MFPAMRLSNTSFVRIDGTNVALLATVDSEARIALRELRHKKKELLHYQRRPVRRRKAIKLRNQRAMRIGTSPEMSPWSHVLRSLGAVLVLIIGLEPIFASPLAAHTGCCHGRPQHARRSPAERQRSHIARPGQVSAEVVAECMQPKKTVGCLTHPAANV
jgi:hypothetical protein